MTSIYAEHALGKTVDFCKIDVEGYEEQVIKGIDFSILRPLVFSVEDNKSTANETWEPILLRNGYKFIGAYGVDRYYVLESQIEKLNVKNILDFSNYRKIYYFVTEDDFWFRLGKKMVSMFRNITPKWLQRKIMASLSRE